MWCSDCQTPFETNPDSIVQVCPGCRHSQKSGQRKRRLPKLDGLRDDQGHRRQKRLHDSLRADQRSEYDLESTAQTSSAAPIDPGLSWGRRPAVHLVAFGLFVFLVGQALQIWAFLNEVFLIWSLANLVSIGGITVALGAVFVSLQGFDRRLRELARLVGRAEITSRPKRRTFRQRLMGSRS